MATLPDATALGERPQIQPRTSVASYDLPNLRTAGMAGQNIERAGSELSQAGAIIEQTNAKYDTINAEDAFNKLKEQAATLQFDPQTGFMQARGGNAVGQDFAKTYTDQFAGAVAKIGDGLQNQQQKLMFQQRAAIATGQFQSSLMQHQAQQTTVFANDTDNSTIKNGLSAIAANPYDQVRYDTEMLNVNATLAAKFQRNGYSAPMADQERRSITSAALASRVGGMMLDNPLKAEAFYHDHAQEFEPAQFLQLGREVTREVKTVQQRDIAHSIVYGGVKPLDPAVMQPAAGDAPPLQGVVKSLEGGTDAAGNSRTSPKGAQGEMQVMPATAANPGYGVTPAKDDSPAELARVGRDYLGAMTARYQNPALILAAYNAGPGQVDQWITKFGDPRSGQISSADWVAKIPFKETASYVGKGLGMLGADNSSNPAAQQPPTAHELKTRLPDMVQQARDTATRMYPNDPVFADGVASRVASYGGLIVSAQQAQQQAATDQLTRGIVGQTPDGSDKPTSIDDLLARPGMKDAWNKATPEVQLAIQGRLAKGEKGLTQDGFNRYYQLSGMAASNPAGFKGLDLTKEFGNMPDHLLLNLSNVQSSIDKHDASAQARDINLAHAKSAVESMLKPVVLATQDKEQQAVIRDTFYGKLQEAMQTYHDDPKNNKWPDTVTTQKMGAALLVPGKQTTPYWFDQDTRAFQSEDLSKFYVPIPSDQKDALSRNFQNAMGRAPQGDELQQWYTKFKLAKGGK